MDSEDRLRISRGQLLRAALGASGFGALAACMRTGGAGTSLLPSSASEALRRHGIAPAAYPWDQEKVTLRIVNKTGKYANDQIFWISTAKNFNGRYVHLTSAGEWELCKFSDLKRNGPLEGYADYNISLAESGTELTLPWANSGTLWFCMKDKLKIGLNGSGEAISLREPAAQTPTDPNFKYLWDKVEYSFNPPAVKDCNFTANTTLITKLALPITVGLETSNGRKQEGGLVEPGGQAAIYNAFKDAPVFKDLVVAADGHPIRVIGPSVGVDAPPTDIHAYKLKETFDEYIALCAGRYPSKQRAFTVDFGNVRYSCYFDTNGLIHVDAPPGQTPSFTFGPIDSTSIWLCDGKKIPHAGTEGHIANVILSAFNRGILYDHAQQPFCDHTKFYQNAIGLNVWCKTIHANFKGGKVYAFPYDDQCGEYSSTVSFDIPPCVKPTVTWTVTLEKIDWF